MKLSLLLGAVTLLQGCASIAVHEQGELAKADMLFDDRSQRAFSETTLAMLEPGVAASGGGSATGCSSCR